MDTRNECTTFIYREYVFATVNTFHASNRCVDGTIHSPHPMMFLDDKKNNETYTFREMLKQEDSVDFIQAMIKEACDHETQGHWKVIP